ncbi:MAG: hypothetical protein A2038_15520 [Deltaproteobacteria bacterium GWA2_57_13]|nr:MAG: hypothetical protein A2038_15520 [Deltaproteobacteria bacterium GWA2_57_13]
MIRFQIVERTGAHLYRQLIEAMRSGDLRTFYLTGRGRKVSHVNPTYAGWMNWSHTDGVITCEVISPRKPGSEWRLFSAFVGRLADRFAEMIHCVNVQFSDSIPATGARTGRKRARRKR